ncbi:MAG: DUF2219 family protein [Limimaricola sp.]|uniref:lipid A-modifier LpxR family protein n=1 Tax=Limimaricola sp. TaxID=2211665 RepID=UPI001D608B8B|nr:lipid A-modifier LpxR family protein [Limimaricola sp.]MBI1417774.1 DUF2219 family protein [Limimaricola sp.]
MRFPFAALLALAFLYTPVARADGWFGGRTTLGYGRLFDNDQLGDGMDRWRSGAYAVSVIRGKSWDGALPTTPGELLEYRFRAEIIAPRYLNGPGSDDRPYVGALSFGVHTHFQAAGQEVALGADVVAIGPQTGLGDFQTALHKALSMPTPRVLDTQLGNQVQLGATLEVGHNFRLNDRLTVRPFFEAQAGVENLFRLGTDVIIGAVGQTDMLVRDVPTGQFYRAVEGQPNGFGYVLGADFASVGRSIYYPADRGITPESTRYRVRAGLHWQIAEKVSFFYGATYLSPEFVGQPEGQVVGSLKLNFNF